MYKKFLTLVMLLITLDIAKAAGYGTYSDTTSAQNDSYTSKQNQDRNQPATSNQPKLWDIPVENRYFFGSLSLTNNFGSVFSGDSSLNKGFVNMGWSVDLGIRAENYAMLIEYHQISFKDKYGFYKFNMSTPTVQVHRYFTDTAYVIFGIGNTIATYNQYKESGVALLGGLGLSMPITNNVIININDIISYGRLVGDGSPKNYFNNSIRIGASYAVAARKK